ncbi:MAG: tRNA pseudouridine(55) synthase TruB [Clostridia bacterium]|nr:tRNA pseudouridine(55) synthase TruB [Clostridia bacterium]
MTGFIVVDKAEGASSAQEVNIIKRLAKTPCGHMGTLDPMASGVLPVAIGNAARLFDYFLNKDKTYIASFEFGTDSDTLDTTGKILAAGGKVPSGDEILSVLPKLCGEVMQIPPKYSAKCVNGKRGYQLAREGKDFNLPPKKVKIHSIKLLEKQSENTFSFEINCGGGTYIRSIARDMGKMLSTCAVMSSLVRTESGCFNLNNSVKTKDLTADNINGFIIATESVLPFASIYPTEDEAKRLFNGLSIRTNLSDGIYKIFFTDGSFYGLAEVKETNLKVRTKLC